LHGFSAYLKTRHPLFILANSVKWAVFEEALKKKFRPIHGRPCKPVRLMVGLEQYANAN